MLIENVIGKHKQAQNNETAWKYAIIGIGININQAIFDPGLKNVVSLKQITGKHFEVADLAKELHQKIIKRTNALNTGYFDQLMEEYNALLFKKDCAVKLRKGNIEFDTVIKSVTKNGQLYTVDRIDNFFDFGEVEWVI